MKRILSFINEHRWLAIVLAFLVLAIILISKNRNGVEYYTVQRQDIEESILLSGDVRTKDKADLGFATSGRIVNIFVKNNQEVDVGRTLAQLEIDSLLADLKIKEINSNTSDIDLESAEDELDKVTAQEDTKVENAYRTLLSDDLEPIADSASYTMATPTITGSYNGDQDGQYKLRIIYENNRYELRTFGLENTIVEINEEGFTPVGTRGLYISFSDDLDDYRDTIWWLDLPNKNGSSYVTNLNSYNEALKNRDRNIKTAQSSYDNLLSQSGNTDSVAQAEIDKIKAEIKKNTIIAPFSGMVTNIEKAVGENVSVGERVITVVSDGGLEVILQVSELDVPKLIPGMPVVITFDALPKEEFTGTLETINSRDTQIDGVPVYEAFVSVAPDARIRTGMSARGEVLIGESRDVLALPKYLLTSEGGETFVNAQGVNGSIEKRQVVIGITGSNSMVEIISGLKEGDKIIVEE